MLAEMPVAQIQMATKDWRRIELIINNAQEIASALYPAYRGKKELRPRELAAQWARHNFKGLLESAVVMEDTKQAEGTTIYVLLAGVTALIQAMDAVLSDKTLYKRVYRRHRFSDASSLCKYIHAEDSPAEEEEVDALPLAVDGDLINRFNGLITSCSKITDLQGLFG